MKKPAILIVALLILVIGGLVIWKTNKNNAQTTQQEEQIDLPINTIPVEERPFITLTPDASGRNLVFHVAGAPQQGELEYEIVYNAADKQEGVFGRLDLEIEKQPIEKTLLLGSKSGGGKITYHEGITGGSMTVTYGETRLKEQFNFLRFDPKDPTVSSSDLKFTVSLPTSSLKKDSVVVTMKSFGLPTKLEGELLAGPYAYLPSTPIKGEVKVELKLPSEATTGTIYTFVDGSWRKLKTTVKEGLATATTTIGNVFVITE